MIDFAAPTLDLTLALVGKRRIDPNHIAGMKRDLGMIFEVVATSLGASAGVRGARLTLITGLADGADQIAGALFLAGASNSVERVLGAILPCPGEEFARNSPVEDLAGCVRRRRTA
jgi:hypothetical protein